MNKSSFYQPFFLFLKAGALYAMGVSLALLLIFLNFYGFLAVWVRLQKPPEPAVEIVNAGMDGGLFVKTAEGPIYSLDTRRKARWELVDEQVNPGSYSGCNPEESYKQYDVRNHPAFYWFRKQILDCQVAWLTYENVKSNLVFVLLSNGTIYQWHDRDGIDTWLLTLCIVPLATMFSGLLFIHILRRRPHQESSQVVRSV